MVCSYSLHVDMLDSEDAYFKISHSNAFMACKFMARGLTHVLYRIIELKFYLQKHYFFLLVLHNTLQDHLFLVSIWSFSKEVGYTFLTNGCECCNMSSRGLESKLESFDHNPLDYHHIILVLVPHNFLISFRDNQLKFSHQDNS